MEALALDSASSSSPDGQLIFIRIILFFTSILVIGMELFAIYDPEEAYMLFRRGLKYERDVELTDMYKDFIRYGSVFGLAIYSLFFVLAGEHIVLLLAYLTVCYFYYRSTR
ncbi:hypothetical protein PRVXT_001255 [Proteinivorax tanatarense]|uniref:Uncharacterized protein n=1 Tax=Proteinivorax tanatarense TaxID=1260629 RepID=A0AAU7VPP2_9FIRM